MIKSKIKEKIFFHFDKMYVSKKEMLLQQYFHETLLSSRVLHS